MHKEVTSNSGSLPDVRIENETHNEQIALSNGQIALSNGQVATPNGRTFSQSSSCDSYDSVFIVSFILNVTCSIVDTFDIKNQKLY